MIAPPEWIVLPYWVMVLSAIINIILILLESSTKKECDNSFLSGTKTMEDVKRRDKLTIIPRIYFIIIYSGFFLLDTTTEWKLFWGRWGIFGILFIDSYFHFANYLDYHWFTILKYLKFNKNKFRRD